MRAWIQKLTLCAALTTAWLMPSFALAGVQSGKVMMVMENQLALIDSSTDEMHRFDISAAAIYRNGLPVASAALKSGDWVTVTTEMQDGALVATLVEAGSDR
jgi:hypothetical protein